ncbi:hypothetical protein A2164_04220 [Candidatus Curtissbacteria bacterium RBG_13_35_7]|uniref:DUF1616 domain-containing protein n=1 Tax=Candidatus Curtissbacteria bacterium RBG_13_35_7 TaxID=1797705 RepID=A0A1F5G567_9BACT|nr:MAG: hypothetical protein A2164_04220 [Candidatus Curtissbacteria bacterium RBG_13_35_7]
MKKQYLLQIGLNFAAIVLLIALILTPFYFARNVSQIAGIKSETPYLIISQVENFPGLELNQEDNQYQISFTKQSASQAYLAVLILNNPTSETKSYSLQVTGDTTTAFFGQDLENQITQINVPSGASVPISLISSDSQQDKQLITFSIHSN